MLYFILTFSGYYLSLIFTAVAIYYFQRYKILDVPNHRSNHFSATLTGGGVSIVLTLSLIALLSYLSSADNFFLYFIVAILLLAAVSFLDDLKDLPILVRILFQILSIGILLYGSLGDLDHKHLLLFGFAILVFLNLYNFMDGIDGSNSVEAIHISSGIALLSIFTEAVPLEIVALACTIAGSCFAFLKYNWHPARIFLGDTGSTSLGLILGWMLLILAIQGLYASAVILPLYYIADSGVTILKRLYMRKKIWHPHSEHFYQIAIKNGLSHDQVVKKIIYCNMLLLLLSVTSLNNPLISVALAVITTTYVLYNLSQKPNKKVL